MTDKQIIFKCDVDCKRKNTEECFELDCIKGQESILKQLQAKEQECEELKNELIDVKWEIESQDIELNDKEEELDQLEEENKELRQLLSKEPLALQALQRAYSSYKKSTDVFYKMAKDYKQALTEIKEIAEFDCSCGHNQMCICNVCDKFDEILQKCEVIDE